MNIALKQFSNAFVIYVVLHKKKGFDKMEKKYNIEFTEEEVILANNIFKIMSNNINKKFAKIKNKNINNKVNKELNLVYSIVNKFYNAINKK